MLAEPAKRHRLEGGPRMTHLKPAATFLAVLASGAAAGA
jgi:hypothetical protein